MADGVGVEGAEGVWGVGVGVGVPTEDCEAEPQWKPME